MISTQKGHRVIQLTPKQIAGSVWKVQITIWTSVCGFLSADGVSREIKDAIKDAMAAVDLHETVMHKFQINLPPEKRKQVKPLEYLI